MNQFYCHATYVFGSLRFGGAISQYCLSSLFNIPFRFCKWNFHILWQPIIMINSKCHKMIKLNNGGPNVGHRFQRKKKIHLFRYRERYTWCSATYARVFDIFLEQKANKANRKNYTSSSTAVSRWGWDWWCISPTGECVSPDFFMCVCGFHSKSIYRRWSIANPFLIHRKTHN